MKIIQISGANAQLVLSPDDFSDQVVLQPNFLIVASEGAGTYIKIFVPDGKTLKSPFCSFMILITDSNTGIEVNLASDNGFVGAAGGQSYVTDPSPAGSAAIIQGIGTNTTPAWNIVQPFNSGSGSGGAPVPIKFKTTAGQNSYGVGYEPTLALLAGKTIDALRMASNFLPSENYNAAPVTLPLLFTDIEVFQGDDVTIWYH